jgi:predicted MPP superfamily phosphohydrolase
MPIADSLILLPALGFPAIAEWDSDRRAYKIFVSMLIIPQGRSWPRDNNAQRRLIANELGLEQFNTHYSDDIWNDFSGSDVIHIRPENIELLTPLRSQNKIDWTSQPNFIRMYKRAFFSAYRRRIGARASTEGAEGAVVHVELMLTIPMEDPGMYSLVSRSEREQIRSRSEERPTTINEILVNLHAPGSRRPHTPALDAFMDNGRMIVLHHPVYVPPRAKEYLNIAHLSDTHVSRRWDAMQYWSRVRKTEHDSHWRFHGPSRSTIQVENRERFLGYRQHWNRFNNPNRRFEEALESVNTSDDVDIIIITGDLIDYNVGYRDMPGEHEVRNMNYLTHNRSRHGSYYHNSNWPLLYELLIKNYRKPVFTILGNHDYRWDIYGPMATGAPIAGWGEQNFAYALGIDVHRGPRRERREREQDQRTALHLIYPSAMADRSTLSALEKDYQFVEWYNFVINPALDFRFNYRQMAFLFLDWRVNERHRGLVRRFSGPWAEDSLTPQQRVMITNFLTRNSEKLAIISMHATVFCTPTNSYNNGIIVEDGDRQEQEQSHLSQGTINRGRRGFIRQLDGRQEAQTIVLSGHAHKNRIYITERERDRVQNFEPQDRSDWLALPNNRAFYCVTTSTAYRKSMDSFMTPGYRVIRITDSRSETQLRSIRIPQNQALSRQELPIGHPNRRE